MKILPSILKTLAVGAVVCCTLTANAQNLVQDPGFELSPGAPPGSPGGFSSSWTLVPAAGTGAGQQFSNVGTLGLFAHSGNKYANLAPAIGQVGALQQVLSTAAGTAYSVSFWLANNSAVPVNLFQVYINGVLLTTNFGSTITSPSFPSDGVYRLVTSSFVAAGASSTLEFRYRHDDDFWRLDDVNVSRAAAAPEGGATLWVAVPLFAGLCLLHRRTRRSPASV